MVRLALCALGLWFPFMVQAQFNCSTNAGTITIIGYTGPGGAVSIPSSIGGLPVTSIDGWAFHVNLTNVWIPASVTNIGYLAFVEAFNLSEFAVDALNPVYSSLAGVLFDKTQSTLIQFPPARAGSYLVREGLTAIANSAFYFRTNLTSINFPSSLTGIGWSAFCGCANLTNVVIPDGVIELGDNAFAVCDELTNVMVGNGVTSIPAGTFQACGKLSNVTLGSGITSIGKLAFDSCRNLTRIRIPDSVINIDNQAFDFCTNLSSLTIGNGVTSIGPYAFAECRSLASLAIPDSVTNIGNSAFMRCTNLASLSLPHNNTIIGEHAFAGCIGLSTLTIPYGFTRIGDWAFESCTRLTNITVAPGVASIGSQAFNGCFRLTAAYFLGDSPDGSSFAFWGDNNTTIYYLPGTSGWGPTSCGRPAVLWNPQMQATGASFGGHTNSFAFRIFGSSNLVIVVEACTDLAHPVWTALQTNCLFGGSADFNDPAWTNFPAHFYRLRSP